MLYSSSMVYKYSSTVQIPENLIKGPIVNSQPHQMSGNNLLTL